MSESTHGEAKFVVMLGVLHLEMALCNTLGDLLEVTGLTTAITEADIATYGVADSFLKASHRARTRHFHQVTLLSLHNLKNKAFLHLAGENAVTSSMQSWEDKMGKRSPTYLLLEYHSEVDLLDLDGRALLFF
ncbi:hypothetical protein ACROYT_G014058 [Oculina patagonica]